MSVEYLELADYLAIASEITDIDEETITKVLAVHLVKNHPLPDGNKRAAWVSLRLFAEINGWSWKSTPSIDDAEQAVLAIASGD